MREDKDDKEEVLYSSRMITVNIDFRKHSFEVTQDNHTRSNTIISLSSYRGLSKGYSEIQGLDGQTEKVNMFSRLALPYPELVHQVRYLEGYNVPALTSIMAVDVQEDIS